MPHEKRGKERTMLAADLMAEQSRNPEHDTQGTAIKKQYEELNHRFALKMAVVKQKLVDRGLIANSINEVRTLDRVKYMAAIPILVKALQHTDDDREKEAIAALLVSPYATKAVPHLLDEFAKLPSGSLAKWKIADALSECASDRDFDALAILVSDQAQGKAREMLTLALARIPTASSINLLIRLLKDEQVCGHAIMALGRLNAVEAIGAILPFLEHPKSWVRSEARKAVALLRECQKE